jgi:transposase-like protein
MSEPAKKLSEKSPEVTEKATRRRFTLAYKERILTEADQCTGAGELGELLRREGLYSSNLSLWRRQRDLGTLATNHRGRKPNPNKKESQELAKLKRDNARLTERLRQAELIIEVQKKVSEMMGIKLPETDD